MAWLCDLAGVPLGLETPEGVRAYERQSEDARLLFLLNFNAAARLVSLDGEWSDAFTGERPKQVELQPADVRVLTRDK